MYHQLAGFQLAFSKTIILTCVFTASVFIFSYYVMYNHGDDCRASRFIPPKWWHVIDLLHFQWKWLMLFQRSRCDHMNICMPCVFEYISILPILY